MKLERIARFSTTNQYFAQIRINQCFLKNFNAAHKCTVLGSRHLKKCFKLVSYPKKWENNTFTVLSAKRHPFLRLSGAPRYCVAEMSKIISPVKLTLQESRSESSLQKTDLFHS